MPRFIYHAQIYNYIHAQIYNYIHAHADLYIHAQIYLSMLRYIFPCSDLYIHAKIYNYIYCPATNQARAGEPHPNTHIALNQSGPLTETCIIMPRTSIFQKKNLTKRCEERVTDFKVGQLTKELTKEL